MRVQRGGDAYGAAAAARVVQGQVPLLQEEVLRVDMSIKLSGCLSLLSIYIYISISIYLYLYINLAVCLSMYLTDCLSLCLSD